MGLKFKLIAMLALACVTGCTSSVYEFKGLYEGLPFEMPEVQRPSINCLRVCLTDFGAVPDGTTLNTGAFAAAIDQLHERGGGHLDVPAGIWLTGPISLKSGIDLHLSEDAVITFSDDTSLYEVRDLNFEGLDTRRCQSQIGACGCHDISITGEGIIDGNGDSWRELRRDKVNPVKWRTVVAAGQGVLSQDGGRLFPDEGYKAAMEAPHNFNVPMVPMDENFIKRFLRPVMIGFQDCENILLEGCSFHNSPSWNIHPVFCRNIIVKDITVKAPAYAQNGDGIDIDACENVIVSGSVFDVGDDAVCIKSGKDADGRRHGRPTRNLIVSDCTVYHGHGGFVVGSEMSGGVENILVKGCRYFGTETGLRFKSCRGRGGVVRNIWIKDIVMKDIMTDAVVFNLDYRGKSAFTRLSQGGWEDFEITPGKADETTPEFRDIHIENIRCAGAGSAMTFIGLPEKPLTGIDISDSSISSERGAVFAYCREISLKGLHILRHTGEEITLIHSDPVAR